MAGSPGGKEVGRVSVKVVPDTSRFAQELRSQLKRLEKQLKVELPVTADTDRVTTAVRKAKEQAERNKIELEAEVQSDGVVRAARRARLIAQKATTAIKLTASLNMKQTLATIWAQMKVVQAAVQGYRIRLPIELVSLSKILAVFTALAATLLTSHHLILGVGGALKALGGIALTLPAIFAAAGVGVAALVVGLRGFFGALSNAGDAAAFEQSLKKLAPSAQASARALARFREPLIEIRKATQESLFAGMAQSFSKLGTLLPPLKSGMVSVAAGIREMGRSWIVMATSQRSVQDLDTIMKGTAKAFKTARPAAADFAEALKDIAVVGSSFLPRMGQSVANVARRFKDFIANARETGQLAKWIEQGIAKFREFGAVISNVWQIFGNIAQAMRGGEGLLDILTRVTDKLREMTASGAGQAAWSNLAAVMREVLDVAGDVLEELFNSLSDVLKELTPFLLEFARSLGGALVGALKAVTPPLKAMSKFLSENKAVMAPLLVGIASLVTGFKLLSSAATGIQAVARGFIAIRAAGVMLWTTMVGLPAAIGRAATAVATFATTTIPAMLRTAAGFVTMAASATANAAIVAGAWIKNAVKMTAVWVANMARMVAVSVATWVRMAAVAMANAVRMAAAWFIALGPIGWVIAAVIAIVALIIMNWDTIKKYTIIVWNAIVDAVVAAWNWLSATAVSVWNWITNAVSTAVSAVRGVVVAIWNAIVAHVVGQWNMAKAVASAVWNFITSAISTATNAVRSVVTSVWNAITSFVTNAWNRIRSGAVSAWNAITSAVRGAINRVRSTVSSGFNAVVGFVRSIPGRIRSALGNLGSLLVGAGRSLIQGFVNGIKGMIGSAISAVKGVVTSVRNFFPFSPAKTGPFSGKGYTLYSGRALAEDWARGIRDKAGLGAEAITDMMDGANKVASAEWNGHITSDGFGGVANAVFDGVMSAFNGSKLQVDGNGMAKVVNNVNSRNARR